MKHVARLTCLLLLAIWLIVPALATAALPDHTDKFFVNDFADVLTEDEEETIYRLGRELYEKTTAQVVAVTVNTTDGEEIRQYGYQLATKWGVGDAEKDNGVLLMLASKDRKIDIEVGYGLEGALPDGKCGRILDHYAMPYLTVNQFGKGVSEAYRALINEVYLEYGLEPDADYTPLDELEEENDPLIGFFSLLLLMVILSFFIFGRSRRSFHLLPMIFSGVVDGIGFGGHSSGSSGGFGGFSGGGGSFGGGGASRGF